MTTATVELPEAKVGQARNAISLLRKKLCQAFIEREGEIDATILSMISGEHCWLTGPWGTGKSLMLRYICEAIEHSVYFEYLMMKDTDRSELLGYVDMEAVQNERKWRRRMENHLPTAHFVFLDEFPRASSATANILLRATNEKEIIDMGGKTKCNLLTAVVAGNDWPVGDGFQEWGAIFDRFLIRRLVKPVSAVGRARLAFGDLPEVGLCCTLDDIRFASESSQTIPVSDAAKDVFMLILEKLANEGINPGDRRIRKSVKVCRAAAYLDGADEVKVHHLEPLIDVLWEDPVNHPKKAAEIIAPLANPVGAKITSTLIEVDDALKGAFKDKPAMAVALKKLENSLETIAKIPADGPSGEKAKQLADHIKAEQLKLAVALSGGLIK